MKGLWKKAFFPTQNIVFFLNGFPFPLMSNKYILPASLPREGICKGCCIALFVSPSENTNKRRFAFDDNTTWTSACMGRYWNI